MLMLLFALAFPASVFADTQQVQSEKVTINSINSSYLKGSKVTIAGTTTFNEVTVKVLAPDKTNLFYDIASVSAGSYSTSFTLPETSSLGTYQVVVGKGTEVKNAVFNVSSGNGGNNGGNNGGSTPSTPSTGGTTTPKPNPAPSSVVIKPADLPKPQNGMLSVNVSIPQNQASTEVLLPGNLSQLAGDSNVQLNWGTASLVIPKEVVDSLTKLIPSDKQNDSQISLQIDQLSTEQAGQISKANSTNGGTVQPASPILELTLSAKDSSGKTTRLDQFSKPVVLTFQLTGQSNQALLGVYYIPDSGSMQYIGGKITGNTMTAEVTHFSKYGVFAYDKSYSDVAASHWANQVIKELTAKHVVNGVTDTSFAPEKEITRAEFAAMLVRQLNLKATKTVQLDDVSQNSWYADAIAAAYSNGLVNGISQTQFGPDKKITREEMSVMIVKAYNLTTGKNSGSGSASFKDSKDISTWAQDYVGTAVKEGLLKGRSTDTFAPKKQATRAEASQVMYNFIHKL